jgi:predicted TIM-barrel fold metal-dependent hydrolase
MIDADTLLLRDFRPEQMVKLPTQEVGRAAYPVVDVHNHLGRWHAKGEPAWSVADVDELLGVMDDCNVAAIVNLDGGWDDELELNLDRYDRAHPGRFATFARLDWSMCTEPGWPKRMVDSIEDSARRGARGVKVWKDVGLRVRDEAGHLVLVSDPRLSDVWAAAAAHQLPILIHTADPAAFFRPLDARNERLEELARHPDWHFAGEEFPSLKTLLDALEQMVAEHPDLTVIGAHVGCYAEDLGWVGRMLADHPNFHVDIAARIAELGRQPRTTKKLIEAHPDRVLFGTDAFPPDPRVYRRYFRFLETDDECFPYSEAEPPPTGRWTISALDLHGEALASVYGGNAARLVRGIALTDTSAR